MQEAVRLGQITTGHAKILKGLKKPDRQIALCKEIIARGHSVRALESLLKEERPKSKDSGRAEAPEKTSHLQAIEEELRQTLATRVEIRLRGPDRGLFILAFESNDDFERLLDRLRG